MARRVLRSGGAAAMIRLFRRAANTAVIDRLYLSVVEASRAPTLFRDLAVPDTFEGRFESLALHAALVLRRLQACPVPGPDMAQELVDTLFRHFDRTLREMGVGDTTVPKRMKTMAEAFLGRGAAYDAALRDSGDALAVALSRNVYTGRRDGAVLARYVAKTAALLGETPLTTFMEGGAPFPDPAAFTAETTP